MGNMNIQVQCCVCSRIRQGIRWVANVRPSQQETSHSYCPTCLVAAMANADGQMAANRISKPAS